MQQPCRIRYRRRAVAASPAVSAGGAAAGPIETTPSGEVRLRVDLDLCQGHAVCVNEAPEVFAIDKKENKVVIQIENPSEEQMKGVGLAVEHCPTRALSLEKN